MVKTVRPKASDTPSSPIPTPGNAAASTALPQPPNTSRKVPRDSARVLFMIFIAFLLRHSNFGFWFPSIQSARCLNDHLQTHARHDGGTRNASGRTNHLTIAGQPPPRRKVKVVKDFKLMLD